ncbi:MAG: hypothetical protein KBE03_03515 [Leptotrichiaceae bacterium]|nr:hypothetical protein [Leptotrichiaceae bacterium]
MEAGKRLSVFFLIMVILVIGFLIVVNDLNKIAEFKCVDNELFKEEVTKEGIILKTRTFKNQHKKCTIIDGVIFDYDNEDLKRVY